MEDETIIEWSKEDLISNIQTIYDTVQSSIDELFASSASRNANLFKGEFNPDNIDYKFHDDDMGFDDKVCAYKVFDIPYNKFALHDDNLKNDADIISAINNVYIAPVTSLLKRDVDNLQNDCMSTFVKFSGGVDDGRVCAYIIYNGKLTTEGTIIALEDGSGWSDWSGLNRNPYKSKASSNAYTVNGGISLSTSALNSDKRSEILKKLDGDKTYIASSITKVFEQFRETYGSSWCIFTSKMLENASMAESLQSKLSSYTSYNMDYIAADKKHVAESKSVEFIPVILAYDAVCIAEVSSAIGRKNNIESGISAVTKVLCVFYNTITGDIATPVIVNCKNKQTIVSECKDYSEVAFTKESLDIISFSKNHNPKYSGLLGNDLNHTMYPIEDDVLFEDASFNKIRKSLPASAFGLPEDRKFPLYTKDGKVDTTHLKSAIKLFGHCQESKKKKLATAIYKAVKKSGDESLLDKNQEWMAYYNGKVVAREKADILKATTPYDSYIAQVTYENYWNTVRMTNSLLDYKESVKKLSSFFQYEMVNVELPTSFKYLTREMTMAKSIPGMTRESSLFANNLKPNRRFTPEFIAHLKNVCDIISEESCIIDHIEVVDSKEFRVKAILNV